MAVDIAKLSISALYMYSLWLAALPWEIRRAVAVSRSVRLGRAKGLLSSQHIHCAAETIAKESNAYWEVYTR